MLKWLKFNALGTYLFTRRHGELVGEDGDRNLYYRERKATDWRTERRWVVYADGAEPDGSRVPPGWAGWIHHRLEKAPTQQALPVKRWEKPHLPNLTGTDQAYLPPGHIAKGGKRDHSTGDYEAWRP